MTVVYNEGLTFDDVLIRPGYSELSSRLDADYTVDAFGYKGLAPIMVANMLDVATIDMFHALSPLKIMVPLNRINRTEDERLLELTAAWAEKGENGYEVPIAAAVGIGERDFCKKIASTVDVFLLDVAYAYTKNICEEIKWMKNEFPGKYLVVGNVATQEAASHLYMIGADYVKVGVGSGSVCSTRIVTGCGVPQLSAVLECSSDADVISDGGARGSADCVKALAAGADFVMLGGAFAGTEESYDDGTGTKIYRGLASSAAHANKRGIIPEGISAIVPNKGHADKVAKNLLSGIRQGMGLVGAANLKELREKAVFQRISHATTIENAPHIKI